MRLRSCGRRLFAGTLHNFLPLRKSAEEYRPLRNRSSLLEALNGRRRRRRRRRQINRARRMIFIAALVSTTSIAARG